MTRSKSRRTKDSIETCDRLYFFRQCAYLLVNASEVVKCSNACLDSQRIMGSPCHPGDQWHEPRDLKKHSKKTSSSNNSSNGRGKRWKRDIQAPLIFY